MMDVTGFLQEVEESGRGDRVVYVREVPPRPARYGAPARPLLSAIESMLADRGIDRLFVHQARAIDLARDGRDVLVATGPASGKSLCYILPILENLLATPDDRALLLHPTKALSRDQLRAFLVAARASGLGDVVAGVYDGDTPGPERRRLRDGARVIFTNPDMLHAALLPEHGRWSPFLARLRILVLDELHVYDGIFGANVANLLRRLFRVCAHYGASPVTIACSATVGNPAELAKRLLSRPVPVVAKDGSPRGKRTYVFWNPPVTRATRRRSRRSANVEAQEIMTALVRRGVPTITFSKAKITAEIIHRYVGEALTREAPHLAGKVTPYRGGYRPEERREIERRLFAGDLLGVSTTPALELGIDVGGLDACIVVGWPGTVSSFLQQSGRAGRREDDALIVLVGLDTATNQFVLRHPTYVFDRLPEDVAIEPTNPFVLLGQLRCAVCELPLSDREAPEFGPEATAVLDVLEANRKVRRIRENWYHAASETPQHEISLRDVTDRNVLVEDVDSGQIIGEVSKFDSQSLLHEGAIYLHRGETWRVLRLDLTKCVATACREDVDYYTQPLGGDDVHHVDRVLGERPVGEGRAYYGEVTAYFRVFAYEKIRFYTLDTVSRHGVDLPTWPIETTAAWFVPGEAILAGVRRAGHDPASGLCGIGYAARMLLPLFVSARTMDVSHSVGAVNAPWSAVFLWEHYPRGAGYAQKAYEHLGELLLAVRDAIRDCPCRSGCPLCVGKPLHVYTVANPERGEGAIPDKTAALAILDGMLGDGSGLSGPERGVLVDSGEALRTRLTLALRRRLEHMREPDVLHPVEPVPPSGPPAPEAEERLDVPDAARRGERRRRAEKIRRLSPRRPPS